MDGKLWTFGLLDFWTFGLLDFWTFGLLDFWTFGLLEFWTSIFFSTATNPGYHVAQLRKLLQEDFYGFPLVEGE